MKNFGVQVLVSLIAALILLYLQFIYENGIPDPVFYLLGIIAVIWLLINSYRLFHTAIVAARDNKQIPSFTRKTARGSFYGPFDEFYVTIKNFKWNVALRQKDKVLVYFLGPKCPKCLTDLNSRKTYWGKYIYSCPNGDFSKKMKENKYTLFHNCEKIFKAKQEKEKGLKHYEL